jgi:phosphatidylglycerophosphate synthase
MTETLKNTFITLAIIVLLFASYAGFWIIVLAIIMSVVYMVVKMFRALDEPEEEYDYHKEFYRKL